MKKFILIALMQASLQAGAQVGFNNPNPHSSSILDIKSIDKGLLIPRLNSAQRFNIANPAHGLLVFDTEQAVFYFYDSLAAGVPGGKGWMALNSWKIQENTADSALFTLTAGNVGIGTNTPQAKLDVMGHVRAGDSLTTPKAALSRMDMIGQAVHSIDANSFYQRDNKAYITLKDELFLRNINDPNATGGAFRFNTLSGDMQAIGTVNGAMMKSGRYELNFNGGDNHPAPGLDGAFYNSNGQVHISVDDNLYIRDANDGNTKFSFNTDNGEMRANGAIYSDNKKLVTDGVWQQEIVLLKGIEYSSGNIKNLNIYPCSNNEMAQVWLTYIIQGNLCIINYHVNNNNGVQLCSFHAYRIFFDLPPAIYSRLNHSAFGIHNVLRMGTIPVHVGTFGTFDDKADTYSWMVALERTTGRVFFSESYQGMITSPPNGLNDGGTIEDGREYSFQGSLTIMLQ